MGVRIYLEDKVCLNCFSAFNRKTMPSGRLECPKDFSVRKFCCHRCYADYNQGQNHYLYDINGSEREDGYFRVSVGGERVYLHRHLMEQKLGRRLLATEHVHHIDGNNDINNLTIVTNSQHRKHHARIQSRSKNGKFAK